MVGCLQLLKPPFPARGLVPADRAGKGPGGKGKGTARILTFAVLASSFKNLVSSTSVYLFRK